MWTIALAKGMKQSTMYFMLIHGWWTINDSSTKKNLWHIFSLNLKELHLFHSTATVGKWVNQRVLWRKKNTDQFWNYKISNESQLIKYDKHVMKVNVIMVLPIWLNSLHTLSWFIDSKCMTELTLRQCIFSLWWGLIVLITLPTYLHIKIQ